MSTRTTLVRRAAAAAAATAVLGAGALVAGTSPAAAAPPGDRSHICGSFFDLTTDDGLLTHALSDVLEPLFPMAGPAYVKQNTTCLAQRAVNTTACAVPLLNFLRGTGSASC